MWNEPSREELEKLPRLYESEETPLSDKLIHMHFFLAGCDWYVAEYDPQEGILFGYAILNADYENAEWGHISFHELRELRTSQGFEVDRDLHWRPRKVAEIERIRAG